MDGGGGRAAAQAAAHRAFHLALVALAGHQHLLRVYEPVLLQLQLYMATNMRREAEQRSRRRGRAPAPAAVRRGGRGRPGRVLDELAHHGSRTYLAPELGAPESACAVRARASSSVQGHLLQPPLRTQTVSHGVNAGVFP